MHSARAYTASDSLVGIREGIDACIARLRDDSEPSAYAPGVSAWSVRDHIEHLYRSDRRVLDWVTEALTLPNPDAREHAPNDIGVALLERGSIPRGRGPAPDFTLPKGLDPTPLRTGLEELRELAAGLVPRLAELEGSLHTLPHHVLGHFTPAEWLRFLHLHHRHHEAIIRDIVNA